MLLIFLCGLLAELLSAFVLREVAGVSWPVTGAACLLLAILLAAAVWFWLRDAVRLHLVDDLANLKKRWSTRIAGIQFGAVIIWWAGLPQEWKAAIPNWMLTGAVAISGAAFIVAQMLKQPGLKRPGDGGA